jgi:ribonuclease R
MEIREPEILKILRASDGAIALQEIHRRLPGSDRILLRRMLKAMAKRGEVTCHHGKFWEIASPKKRGKLLSGMLAMTRKGFGFVRLDADSQRANRDMKDVMISERDLGDALDGDTVRVEVTQTTRMGARGRVTGVMKRTRTRIAGLYQQTSERRGEVMPRNPRLPRRISVPLPDKKLKVENFEWVVAEITEFTEHPDDLRGKVVERLGASHERGIDVLLLLRDRGITEEFPDSVMQAAEQLKVNWTEELRKREDLRDLPTVTIDPVTAKDFDDAISIEPVDGGGWRLWVHIADVSYFVTPEDTIDVEARERATSVYPVDRVVPMLPEKLSNDLCSLRPREDRLTMTAEMVVSPDGELSDIRLYPSVIHSNHRLDYDRVQLFFDDAKSDSAKPFASVHDMLLMVRDCSRALRANRERRGALDLDIPEAEIRFHEDGSVLSLGFAKRFEAHRIVEDSMLAANEAVARELTRRGIPMLYRVHEQADEERLLRLKEMLKALGVNLPVSRDGTVSPKDLQATIATLEGRAGGHILRRLVLRALQRAEYSPKNVGHFGLASKCYCHFTSPIRRYPDLVVHRQVRALAEKSPLPYKKDPDGMLDLEDLGGHCSFREREAEDAERDSRTIKSVEYLKQFEGEDFTGRIAGVVSEGLFIEVEPHAVEGFVHVRALKDDHYEIDPLGIELVGRSSGRRYRLTDPVTVRLIRARVMEGELDLELADQPEPARKGSKGGAFRPQPRGRTSGGPARGHKGGKYRR